MPLRDESDESTAKDYNGRRNGVQNDGEKVESVLVQVDETINVSARDILNNESVDGRCKMPNNSTL